ncbi:hypothetical protein EDEG_00019 [Edhazardia aedis USNM 41457]|uniref:Uncharacterized protein n=1 Tax=Edhazardia aedis (strain USNM 41457) TaxID=1003232 RepID=J9D1H3_EDHAE|nr:hypothetical protein EDEG_00019 [Edhazardia aedis USNM 41457]|eukprot:EJW01686.1 hypothetical protein EDEG_00019 [Edhazardia aedis USNM 41457]
MNVENNIICETGVFKNTLLLLFCQAIVFFLLSMKFKYNKYIQYYGFFICIGIKIIHMQEILYFKQKKSPFISEITYFFYILLALISSIHTSFDFLISSRSIFGEKRENFISSSL